MKIQEIRLLANRLDPLIAFYNGTLGLPIADSSAEAVAFQIGPSRLVFERNGQVANPYYHFAFNITESKMDQSVEWLRAKNVAISLLDSYSESWNSHSVYFYDPAGNIMEFIARHSVKSDRDAGDEFDSADMLNISEIGLAAQNVLELSAYVQQQYDMPVYRPGNATFTPIGDEEGLLILSSLNRNWLGSDKKVNIYPLDIGIEQKQKEQIPKDHKQILQYPYTIRTGVRSC